MKHFKSALAMLLALVLVLSCVGNAFAAEKTTIDSVAETEKPTASEKDLTGFKSTEFKLNNSYCYADDEIVRAIVVLEGTPEADVAESNTTKAISHRAKLMAEHKLVFEAMTGIDYEMKFEFTRLLDGFSCDVAYGDLESIAAIDGVKSVHIANSYAVPEVTVAKDTKQLTANLMTGNADMWSVGINGAGMVVAVLDTGLNTKHEAFQDSLGITAASARLSEEDIAKVDTHGDGVYLSAKVPFAYDYADQDQDVEDVQGHGTHVSGTVAGYVGEMSDDGGIEYTFAGGAPAAQLLSMKIFSDEGGGTTDDIYFYAIEDAYALGADVISMSIGAQNGFTYDAALETEIFGNIYQRVTDAGVIFSIAAGNEYSMANYSSYLGNSGYIGPDYTDYGTIANPAAYTGNVSVASAQNIAYPTLTIAVGEGEDAPIFQYSDSCEDYVHGWLDNLGGKSVEYVIVPDTTNSNPLNNGVSIGNAEDYAGIDVTGKIAVVQRGSSTFEEKVENAANAGAVACIIVNNVSANNQGMSIETFEVPAILVTVELLEALQNAGVKTIYTNPSLEIVENEDGWLMSDFSNWGTSPMLTIDPAITSVGGYVYSSVIGADDAYEVYSGTSMATPNASATFANVLGAIYKVNPDISKVEASKLAKDLMESTAYILFDADDAVYSVRKQGAGFASASWAVSNYLSAAYITDPLKELGDDAKKTGIYEFSVALKNDSDADATYKDFETVVLTDALANASSDPSQPIIVNLLSSDTVESTVSYSVNGAAVEEVTVPAGGSVTVDVKIVLSEDQKAYFDQYFTNGAYVEGYVLFNGYEGDEWSNDVHATFLAYYGDWTEAPALESTDFRDIIEADNFLNTTVVDSSGNTYADYGYDYSYVLDFYTNPNIAYLTDVDVTQAFAYAGDNLLGYCDFYNEHISFSTPLYDGTYAYGQNLYMAPYQLRNVRNLVMTVTNKETGEVYYVDDTEYLPKAYYDSGWNASGVFNWDGTDAEGNYVPSGTVATINYDVVLPYGEAEQKNVWSFDVTVDYTAPKIESVVFDPEAHTITVTASDEHYLSMIYLSDDYGTIMDYESFSSDESGKSFTATFATTALEESYAYVYVTAMDYATNEREQKVYLLEEGEDVCVCLSTPYGEIPCKLKTGDMFTVPTAPEVENAQYLFWTTEPVEPTDDPYSAGGDWYWDGDTFYPKEDMTLYAYYGVGEYADYDKLNYWYNQADDYSGEWAICGWNYDAEEYSYLIDDPIALDSNGSEIRVADMEDAEMGDWYVEFYTNSDEIRFVLAHAGGNSSAYTIQNSRNGKYLAAVNNEIAMVEEADESAMWTVVSSETTGTLVYNVANSDLILLYNDEICEFQLFDNSQRLEEISQLVGFDCYPSDYYLLVMYQCDRQYLDISYYATTVTVENPFSDVVDADWFYSYVMTAAGTGLVNGYVDGTFQPNGSLTRAEAVALLYRASGSPAVEGKASFTDLPYEWYQDAIAWAEQNEIVNGVGDGEFEPNEFVTREQLVTMLWRMEGKPEAEAELTGFEDIDSINDWAVEAFQWAVANGIINGTTFEGKTGVYLAPQDNITRAEAAKMFVMYSL